MTRFFALTVGGLVACGGGGQVASAPRARPARQSCDEEARVAAASRPAGGQDAAAAVFALAECERERLLAAEDGAQAASRDGRLADIVRLYDEAGGLAPGRWPVAAPLRTGSLYRALGPGFAAKARAAEQAALDLADETAVEIRMDVEIAEWVKAACQALTEGTKRPRYTVCKPWGGAWR